MSLPQAKKDISEHPAAGTVTEPVDREKLQADVERKLRLYGMFNAMRQSRLPTNDQLDEMLSHLSHQSLAHADSLSADGQILANDVHDMLETLRQLVQQKNADEMLQKFFWHTRDVQFDRAKKDPNDVLPVEGQKMKSDSQQAAYHLRTLLSLVFTNAEVRKLLRDFGLIGRDLLARGAEKVAASARPGEEALRGVDQPGLEGKFISKEGQEAELGEMAQKKEELKAQAGMEAQGQKEGSQGGAGAGEPMQGEGGAQTRTQRLQGKFMDVKESLTGRAPEESRERTQEQAHRIKNFFNDEFFPKERRDQFIFRLKKVVYECQNHEDYQGSMSWLLNFMEEYASRGHTIAGQGKETQKELMGDENLQQALTELRTVLERFANGRSLDTIGEAMRMLYNDAQQDQQLRHWFHDVDEFVRETLLQPGFVLDDQCNERASELKEYGRRFYDDKYKSHFDNLFNSISGWFCAWTEDPLNKKFGNNFAQLAKDTLFDTDGNLKFKADLWTDIRQKIVPGFIEQIGYVPIPRIEYSDDQIDLVIENLALSGKNLFPNLASLETRNFAKLSAYNDIRNETHHELTLTLTQIQADMRDVAFYYRKKTGTPKITDSGLADILLGGEGLTVTTHLVSSNRDPESVFKVKEVLTTIHTLKFGIRDSKHDTLYKMLVPLATGLVKKQLQKAIGNAVRTTFEYVDEQLVAARDQMAEAKAGEDKTRRDVIREQLMQRRREAEKAKEKKGSAGQFKITTLPSEKIIPEGGHSAGWVHRAQERAETARMGEEWRSEAYNI